MSEIRIQGNVSGTGVTTISSANTNNSVIWTFPDTASNATIGYLSPPLSGAPITSPYTLATTDVGLTVVVEAGGAITVPDAVFSPGDQITIVNNDSANITMTMSITTAYIAGVDTDEASLLLATRGVANILFLSSTVCVVSGNVTAGGGGGGSNFLAWVNNSEDGIAVDNEIDSSGNVYVAASLLGNGLATLLKLTSSGALTSAQTIGNPFGTQFSSKAVRIDPTGNIYWCCQNNSASVIQIFKFDTSGSLLWEYEYQVNASSTYVEDMAMDSSGNIYVCGHDGGFGIAFFIKIDSTGAVALFESYIPGAGGRASGIAIDSTGAIILAGDAFDAGSGWRATNVVKYDAAGLYQWGAVFTGIGTNENKAVSVDTSGNIFAFGDSSTLGRFLLVMLDSSGSVLYSTEIEPTPGLTSVYGTGIANDASGNVYALGTFNTGSQGCLTLMKFDSTLTNVWANSFVETSNYNESRRLRITGLQNLYVSGDLYLTSAGFAGPFQAKVSGSGTGTGTYNVGGETVDYSTQTISTAPLSLTYSSATYPGAGVSYLSTATSVTITTPTYTGANLVI